MTWTNQKDIPHHKMSCSAITCSIVEVSVISHHLLRHWLDISLVLGHGEWLPLHHFIHFSLLFLPILHFLNNGYLYTQVFLLLYFHSSSRILKSLRELSEQLNFKLSCLLVVNPLQWEIQILFFHLLNLYFLHPRNLILSLWPFEIETHGTPAEVLPLPIVPISMRNKGGKKEETQH